MVAKIISGKSLIGALNYNENKVKQGKAELIGQSGYAKDAHLLNFYEKLHRLTDLAARNKRVKTNTVHVSLNFATTENLDKHTLNEIAIQYMEGIGFGNQPFLVYQHLDAGHPHIHIVSTNIKSSGERISLHNIGRTKSEETRKALEQRFGLVQAAKTLSNNEGFQLSKVEYGKTDTKRALTNVVNGAIGLYRFTSLPEFNAVLGQFNVTADRGDKGTRMHEKKGLLYWVTDEKGDKIGIPIKASSIAGKPTLRALEDRFQENEVKRKPYIDKTKEVLDACLKTKATKSGFKQALQSKGINVVFRENEHGFLYGVTYVDNRLKVVFNGSDLGKSYSAAALDAWFVKEPSRLLQTGERQSKNVSRSGSQGRVMNDRNIYDREGKGSSLLDDLLKPDFQEGYGTMELFQNKRKKKRKRLLK